MSIYYNFTNVHFNLYLTSLIFQGHSLGIPLGIPRFRIRFLATQMKISTWVFLQHLGEIGYSCLVYDYDATMTIVEMRPILFFQLVL